MSLSACVRQVNGRPVLVVNGEPTTETWAYGWPNAVPDFVAAGLRICQFHVRGRSWWTGPGQYHFADIEAQIEEFLRAAPHVLLIPRVSFGYEGEGWWAAAHPQELAVGRDSAGRDVSYPDVRAHKVECWQSAASQRWVGDAVEAMAAFVRHFESRYGEYILGYQIGGGISCEWFRWWTYVLDVYEDYSPVAAEAFRQFLRTRYRSDAALQAAWNRPEVTLETAEVPTPPQLHRPARGFLRDPDRERQVIDWLEALSEWNVEQLIALCRAAKRACGGRKLVGAFYGYLWPHWNNQNAARSGHLALARVLSCPEIDYISSPYHYDNRNRGGVHHSQTVPQAIERAGKLHLDEIDSFTHLVAPARFHGGHVEIPRTAAETRTILRRDAAAMLGTAGTGWWMDLAHERWYADPDVQAELRDLGQLARQSRDDSCESHAEAALVVDGRGLAYCDLNSNLNLYFTSLPRQFLWSDLGFPLDTILLSEIDRVGQYKLYVFLNCWYADAATRRAVHGRVRRPGVTALWFHAAGFFAEARSGAERIADLTGFAVEMDEHAAVPEIEVSSDGHRLLTDTPDAPRGARRFGARLSEDQARRVVSPNPRGWDTPVSPLFAVVDTEAAILGRYVHSGRPGLACIERHGWIGVYCGAPMLPGWLLRRIAAEAGVHRYTPLGCVVHHRGSLLSVYARAAGDVTIQSPPHLLVQPIEPAGSARTWRPDREHPAAPTITLPFEVNQTRFFRTSRAL